MQQVKAQPPFGFDWPYLLAEWRGLLKPSTITADIWAGITVALVALPLNLALAIAAGVEPGVGITSGIIAGIIASLFGGQRLAITGPAAAMAVVLIEIAQSWGIEGIWLVGLCAGALQLLAGFLRLGKLISYIPMPVMVGFANAIGTLVFFNALDEFLGLPSKPIAHKMQVPAFLHQMVPEFFLDIAELYHRVIAHQEINFIALGIGALALFIAVITPKIAKAIPGQLVAIVVATCAANYWQLPIPRISEIASIPNVLPAPSWPGLPWQSITELFPTIITVFMLGSIESLLSASVADGMSMSTKHNSNQELIGQGLANLVVPFFGGIPVTGVIARTAVNIRAGAKTRLSGIVHALFLMLLIFVMAKHAEQIPLAALSAILILTGIRLVEWEAMKQIWRASRMEGWVVLITTLASVCIDLTAGVMVGLVLTAGLFIRQMSRVEVIAADSSDQQAIAIPNIPACKFVKTYAVDGPLFFGAAERFVENIVIVDSVKIMVLHMGAAKVMDLTGVETLLSIHNQLHRHGGRLLLSNLPPQPLQLLERTKAIDTIGRQNIFHDYKTAVLHANSSMLATTCSACSYKDCQLRSALLDVSHPISKQLKTYQESLAKNDNAPNDRQLDYLIPVNSTHAIPAILANTPIAVLLQAQNMGNLDVDETSAAQIVIGMCVDYRKTLSTPKDWAFTIRREGANMAGCEFAIALAASRGVEYMALIAHNDCAMSNTKETRTAFITTLCEKQKWTETEAAEFFDNHVRSAEIGNEMDFVLAEAERLSALFPGLMIVPMLYRMDDDRLYLIFDWLLQKTPDDPQTKELQAKLAES